MQRCAAAVASQDVALQEDQMDSMQQGIASESQHINSHDRHSYQKEYCG
jgi:hypothetical protein